MLSIFFPTPGPGGIPRGLLGDGPNDPRGGTLLSVTGEVIDPKYDVHPDHITQMSSHKLFLILI